LSTVTFQALAANRAQDKPVTPPFVLAFDRSPAMFAASDEACLGGITVPALGCDESDDARRVEVSEGARWARSRCDMVLSDLGQPLPLRQGVADAILSVSAVQWLLESRRASAGDGGSTCSSAAAPASEASPQQAAEKDSSDWVESPPQPRVNILFQSLCRVMRAGCRMGLQFYPPQGDLDYGARALREGARQAGFHEAEVVLDYAHAPSMSAKKWFLCASKPLASSNLDCQDMAEQDSWCALCWPAVAAKCALQARRAAPQIVQARSRQQHAEVVLRLIRCGRRLHTSMAEGDKKVIARLEAQLTPLQLQLALNLARRLDDLPTTPSNDLAPTAVEEAAPREAAGEEAEGPRTGRKRQKTREDGEEGNEEKEQWQAEDDKADKAAFGSSTTKTELRTAVESRLEELIQVLHHPPDKCWIVPPPPLGHEKASQAATAGQSV